MEERSNYQQMSGPAHILIDFFGRLIGVIVLRPLRATLAQTIRVFNVPILTLVKSQKYHVDTPEDMPNAIALACNYLPRWGFTNLCGESSLFARLVNCCASFEF
jgi:hypothetical protein